MFGLSVAGALAVGFGGATILGAMGSKSAPVQDNSGMNRAAEATAALSQEQLDWAKEVYAETRPDRADATRRAALISDAGLESMNTQNALARDYSSYQRDTFRPLERGIVADSAQYDTPARREAKAAEAIASVQQQTDNQMDIQNRNLARHSVAPGSGAAMAMGNQNAIATAAAKVGAATKAREGVETQGLARRMDAANLGRGLASNQATSAGLALTAGNSSSTNQAGSLAAATSGTGYMQGAYNGATSAMNTSAGIYGNMAGLQIKANESDNAMWGALGSAAGSYFGSSAFKNAGASANSDVNMKENITPVDPEQALAQVEATPVSNWNYKPGTPGAADAGMGETTGPMAQDVKKTMGPKVAPKGKKIDLIAMNGITMAAIQGLSQKVNRMAASAGVPA